MVLCCWILSLDGSNAEPPPNLHLAYRKDEQPRFIPKFKYGYMVRGLEGGTQHGHQVFHNGPYTQGKYFVKLNGGSGQNVEYYADHLGYHPKVVYTSNMGTGSSGARIAFGKAVHNFEHSNMGTGNNLNFTSIPTHLQQLQALNGTRNHNATTNGYSSSAEIINNITANQTSIVTPATETLSRQNELNFTSASAATNEKFNLETSRPALAPVAEDGNRDNVVNPSHGAAIGGGEHVVFAQQPPSDDPYLQPEINEITNGFVSKIVSMLPGIFTAKPKLLKPIIVTDSTVSTSKRETNENGTLDQVVDSAQPEEYHQIPDEQVLEDIYRNENETRDAAGNIVPKYTEAEIKKPHVDVEIEPQMLEEQAVITTTVDIMKSLPLTLDFVPETDNHLTDFGQPIPFNLGVPPPPPPPPPQQEILPPIAPGQTLMEFQFPIHEQPPLPPAAIPDAGQFHYIPIPVLQHQPNIIPLNYANENRTFLDAAFESTNAQPENIPLSVRDQLPLVDTFPKLEYSFVKSFDDVPSNFYKPFKYQSRKPLKLHHTQPLQFDLRKPLQVPYALNVPASHLIPYVKSFPSQHFIQPYVAKQTQPNVPNVIPKAQSVSYNLNYFPKETLRKPSAAVTSQQPQKTPFKPSHPLWDSVYPPSHMYYVTNYVVDKMPGERTARDSFNKRNHQMRRLYVEYGGFKPPMVPSTLIETDETSEKPVDVPKEKSDSS